MNALTLLVVTAIGIGGPPGAPPSRIANARVVVKRDGRLVASSRSGRVRARLRRGLYRVEAELVPPAVARVQHCQAETIRLGTSARSIRLGCSIK